MTKNINNNEIETVEGKYTENMNNNAQEQNYTETNYSQPNKPKRNFLKPLIIGAIAVAITGGVGAYAYDRYETSQRAKIQEAYSNIKMNVGTNDNTQNNNSNNQNSNQATTSTDSNNNQTTNNAQSSVNNQTVAQQNPAQNAKSQAEIRQIVANAISTSEANITFTKVMPEYEDDYAYQNNGQPLYIYDVEARANGLEYDVQVDAVTGKVLKVEIDN